MRFFWEIAIEPVLAALRPRRILEIGVDRALTTEPLVRFAESRGGVVEAIDPDPKIDTVAWERDHGATVRFHRGLSVDVLPGLEPVDVALIDGDHNWYTVRRELELLEQIARDAGAKPPVALLHDVGWPYGRRDLYYDPETVPPAEQQPNALGGLLPGRSELVEDGFNDHLRHAIHEGGERNGVRTAIEGFIEQSPTAWRATYLSAANGLGVLVPESVLEENGRLRDVVDALVEAESLRRVVERLEESRIESETARQRAGRRLAAAIEERDALRARIDAPAPAGGIAGAEHALDRAWTRIDEEHGRRAEIEQQLLGVTRDKLEAEIRLSARERELEEMRATHEERADALERALSDARREVRGSADARAAAEARADRLEHEAAEQEQRADAARGAQDELEKARGALERRLAEREREVERTAAAHSRQTAELEDARETLERALEDARAEAGAALTVARELRERLEVREVETEGLDEQIRLLRDSLTEARVAAEVAHAERIAQGSRVVAAAAERDAQSAAAAAAAPTVPVEPLELSAPEAEAQARFLAECPPHPRSPGDSETDPIALPSMRDRRGVLVGEHPPDAAGPTVDVIVCVHDALDDVRRCLWSLVDKTDRPLRLVIVNDGSDAATTEYLRSVAAAEPALHLVENLEPPHGYTIAANLGMRAATGSYLVLLNSDTVVTHGWLDRIVECGESDPAIGILGPLSNAASHQSVPRLREAGGWSANPLPSFVTADGVATLLAAISPAQRPRFRFVNGFCFVVKRPVVDAIGYFDEEHFGSGYCEENDYCVRAADAGFQLAVVDDAYVFHAKSRSFTTEGRDRLAKHNYQAFLEKHGRERIQAMVETQEADRALTPLRSSLDEALSSERALAAALEDGRRGALRVVFVLPGIGAGGSGGSHSIYQEVHGLRALGVDARIALADRALQRARDAYVDGDEIFETYRDVAELAELTARADVIAATHFKSVRLVAELRERRDDFLPAYYVQDYEPFFSFRDADDLAEAVASYTLIPDCLLFAKTHWLQNVVTARHGVYVAKVEPSIDERIFRAGGTARDGEPVRIAAMIRPRTPRRQPGVTLAALEHLSRTWGPRVRVTTFGCPQPDLERLTDHEPIARFHRGLLSRAEVAELLAGSDVFLDMSIYQAFGRTALEAMACGATAVVPRRGGVWEFVEQGENALAIDTLDAREAIDAIGGLVTDRERLRRMQDGALATAARYSVMRASLSEYLVFEREHRLRFAPSLA